MIQPKPYRFSINEFERMGQLEVYRQPQGERDGELKTYAPGQAASPLLLEAEIAWWG